MIPLFLFNSYFVVELILVQRLAAYNERLPQYAGLIDKTNQNFFSEKQNAAKFPSQSTGFVKKFV